MLPQLMRATRAPGPIIVAKNPLLGFPRVTVRLSGALFALYVAVWLFPPLLGALALVPGSTLGHFHFWNVLTGGLVETSLFGAGVACSATLFMGKQLEPLWGSREMLRFVLLVQGAVGLGTFGALVLAYALTEHAPFLYDPVHGCYGLVASYLVAVKQLIPETETRICGVARVRVKQLPALYFTVYLFITVFAHGELGECLLVSFGTYFSWMYLRFFQPREGGAVGDLSDAFSFASFFPRQARPRVGRLSDAALGLAQSCGCLRPALGGRGSMPAELLSRSALPGSSTDDAQRRRERALRSLDARLADPADDAV